MGGIGALGALSSCSKFRGSLELSGPLTEDMADRLKVVRRHNVRVKGIEPDAVLSVGNGEFAFNVDGTGLQSLPGAYTKIPLATMAHWGWHRMPVPAGVDPGKLRYKLYDFHGRKVPYATDAAGGTGQAATFNYLRENPQRLHLGRIALVLDGKAIEVGQISGIDQELDISSGLVTSKFLLAGVAVEVMTVCHAKEDGIGVKITLASVCGWEIGVDGDRFHMDRRHRVEMEGIGMCRGSARR